jgi:hypothetical protein
MKKFIAVAAAVVLVIGMFLLFSYCKDESIRREIYMQVDESLSGYCESMKERGYFGFSVKDVTYEITDIRSQVADLRYIVAVTWYVDVDLEEHFGVADVRSYLTTLLDGALPFQVTVLGKSRSLTHMDKTLGDNLTVIINGSAPYTGADQYNDLVGDKNKEDYYPGGTCPRCGVGYSANTTFARMVEKHGYCGRGQCGK